MSLQIITAQDNTYSFHIPSLVIGTYPIYQFHLGFAYEVLSFRALRSEIYMGTYSQDMGFYNSTRLHFTAGIELRSWIFRLATGIDTANGYQNWALSAGLSVGLLLQKIHLLPPKSQAPPTGVLPMPLEVSDDWLPTQLQDTPEDAFQVITPEFSDIKNSIKHLNKNIGNSNIIFDGLTDLTTE